MSNSTQDSQSDGYGLRFESFDDIENELERTFKGYAMANPASFFDRTDAQFKIVATAFIERLRAADRRENEAYITTRVKEAEKNGVAWTIIAIDDLHINHVDTYQMSSEIDQIYKGIKNTIRDRFKNETGIDPAPDYPINVTLTTTTNGKET